MKRLLLTAGMLFCLSLLSVARAADDGMQNGAKHEDSTPMPSDKMQSGDKMESGQAKAHSNMKSKKKKGGDAMRDDKMAGDKMHEDGKM